MEQTMEIWLIRHGKTLENEQHRYIGRLDSSLSSVGKAALVCAPLRISIVWVTDRRRTQETAQILFPEAKQIVVPGLAEMDFGSFEGKNFEEMKDDPAYRSWVEGGCLDACPGGESKEVFCERVCSAFLELVKDWHQEEKQTVYPIVAHGGTQMALLERFGEPKRSYYDGQTQAGDGWRLCWEEGKLLVTGQLSFRRQQA